MLKMASGVGTLAMSTKGSPPVEAPENPGSAGAFAPTESPATAAVAVADIEYPATSGPSTMRAAAAWFAEGAIV